MNNDFEQYYAFDIGEELYDVLDKATFGDEQFHKTGITVLDNSAFKIIVMRRIESAVKYFGDSVVEICDQMIFSINDRAFWGGFIDDYSWNCDRKEADNVIFAIYDNTSQKEHIFKRSDKDRTFSNNRTFLNEHSPVKRFRRDRYKEGVLRQNLKTKFSYIFYAIELPKEIDPSDISISWFKPSNHNRKCELLTQNIEEKFIEDFIELEEIVSKYNECGLELDMQNQKKHFSTVPLLLKPWILFLREQIKQYPLFQKIALDKNTQLTFPVENKPDKKYYVAAKLADSAIDVQLDEDKNVFLITFDGTQIEEISLMLDNLEIPPIYDNGEAKIDFIFNPTNICANDIWLYLRKVSFYHYMEYMINSFWRNSLPYAGITIYSILGIMYNKMLNEVEKLYTSMMNEKRVKVKWVNEYKLYQLIHKYVGDSIFQYHPLWLNPQNLDIFLPTQNVAIEYQGEQHYKSIKHFGGEERLARNIERDERKKKLCFENGCRLLYWKYDVPINEDSVLSFITENKIMLVEKKISNMEKTQSNLLSIMAPVIASPVLKKDKQKKEKNVKDEEDKKGAKYIGINSKSTDNIHLEKPMPNNIIFNLGTRREEITSIPKVESESKSKSVSVQATDGFWTALLKNLESKPTLYAIIRNEKRVCAELKDGFVLIKADDQFTVNQLQMDMFLKPLKEAVQKTLGRETEIRIFTLGE